MFPGTARLSVACEMDYRTTKRCLAILRHLGLITAVRTARRRGHADQYQLTIPADLLERLEVLSPADVEAEVERIRKSNRRGSDGPDGPGTGARGTRTEETPRVPETPVQPALRVRLAPVDEAPADSSTGAGSTAPDGSTGASRTVLRVPVCPPTHHYLDTTPTYHSERDLRTELKVVGTAASEDQISPSEKDPEPDPPPLPEKCPHGLSSRLRPDGSPSCALCRVGAPPAEHTTNVVPLPRRVA